MVREWTHLRLRVPPGLHEKIKENAKSEYRSINSEIVMILENHFAETEKAPGSRLTGNTEPDHSSFLASTNPCSSP